MAIRRLIGRNNIKLIVVATVGIVLGLSAPAIGHGVHARFAHNADKVDTYHANGLVRSASTLTGATPDLTTSDQTYGGAVSIRAPRKGFVLVTAAVTVANINSSCTSGCTVVGSLRHVGPGTSSLPSKVTLVNRGSEWTSDNLALTKVFRVPAGVSKFDIRLRRDSGNGTIRGDWAEVSALYVPFGASGGTPR